MHAGTHTHIYTHTSGSSLFDDCSGVYSVSMHQSRSRRHSHLAYQLELPLQPGEAQQQLKIGQAGSYALSIKVRWRVQVIAKGR